MNLSFQVNSPSVYLLHSLIKTFGPRVFTTQRDAAFFGKNAQRKERRAADKQAKGSKHSTSALTNRHERETITSTRNPKMHTLFLHMPKCAGSSMKHLLKEKVGSRFIEDYQSFCKIPQAERPKQVLQSILAPAEAAEQSFIFGHFYPVKYIGAINKQKEKDFLLITFLRDPVERLASHYAYWMANDISGHFLWRRMIRESWTFKRFALEPEMKNFYQQYLNNIPISIFDFVGIHENLAKDWERACSLIGIEHQPLPHSNKNPNNTLKDLSKDVLQEIKHFHSEDYCIYEYAKQMSIRVK